MEDARYMGNTAGVIARSKTGPGHALSRLQIARAKVE
jgi:hypothetical protein